ncbi:MAG: prolyl oligopeptidase family serine peptidase, partial [Planctomycetes bacterium]|nr:prolyl oligopeptidase family serine peptidase [Planctomycetota bacterium]
MVCVVVMPESVAGPQGEGDRLYTARHQATERVAAKWSVQAETGMRNWKRGAVAMAGVLAMTLIAVGGDGEAARGRANEIRFTECLVIKKVGRFGRVPVHTDAIEARIVAGTWLPPVAGDVVKLPDGSQETWEALKANEKGWFASPAFRGGYAYVSIENETRRTMLLHANGHSVVYVNGRPRAGDPYGTGWVRLPVELKAGRNDFLFQVSRGRLNAKLVEPKSSIAFNLSDMTLPDFLVGEKADFMGAVIVTNATSQRLTAATIETAGAGLATVLTRVAPVPPMSLRKVAFRLVADAPGQPGEREVELRLYADDAQRETPIDTAKIKIRVRQPPQSYKRTFISDIDGSVQYYAVKPAWPPPDGAVAPALFLTLHGAGVEATGQADSYNNKSWGHIVAPTNRRHFGFDWEDWGRLDALEVLSHARQALGTDPQRTYLSGHSMGGHGTWHLGVTFPDQFAAIGPSAGWISFWSYAGARRDESESPVRKLLQRAATPSDTLALSRNYLHHGVYILHGEKDDNVPIEQARTMYEHLSGFHRDFDMHEQPGAGHWWGSSDEPGAECLDWPAMFDFFARHYIPTRESVRHIEFTTANPGISSSSHWVAIHGQLRRSAPSTVKILYDPGLRRFTGTTENVARLTLDVRHLPADVDSIAVTLDDQKIEYISLLIPPRRRIDTLEDRPPFP